MLIINPTLLPKALPADCTTSTAQGSRDRAAAVTSSPLTALLALLSLYRLTKAGPEAYSSRTWLASAWQCGQLTVRGALESTSALPRAPA